jgi:hypothetical protein
LTKQSILTLIGVEQRKEKDLARSVDKSKESDSVSSSSKGDDQFLKEAGKVERGKSNSSRRRVSAAK